MSLFFNTHKQSPFKFSMLSLDSARIDVAARLELSPLDERSRTYPGRFVRIPFRAANSDLGVRPQGAGPKIFGQLYRLRPAARSQCVHAAIWRHRWVR